jgi:hypothetical protein
LGNTEQQETMSDFPRKFSCGLSFRPLGWSQRLQQGGSPDFEGRRLSADCEVVSSDLEFSNGPKVKGLLAKFKILDKTQMDLDLSMFKDLGKLPEWMFYPENEFRAAALLSGEFALNSELLEEVWQQVRHGGYQTCTITVNFGQDRLERVDGMNWLWDVTKNPHLLIELVSVVFERGRPSEGTTLADFDK